jgi:hypothetical protein
MVKEYQLDPVRGNLIHADFVQIARDRLLQLSVDIETVGDAATYIAKVVAEQHG